MEEKKSILSKTHGLYRKAVFLLVAALLSYFIRELLIYTNRLSNEMGSIETILYTFIIFVIAYIILLTAFGWN